MLVNMMVGLALHHMVFGVGELAISQLTLPYHLI